MNWKLPAVVIIVAALASSITYFAVQPVIGPRELTKLYVAFDWIPTGRYGVFYPAVEKGYYEQEGLLVTFIRGFGSTDTVTKVGAGTLDFGLADTTAIFVAIGQGVPVKTIGVVYPRHNMAFYFTNPAITKPTDFEGKKLVTSTGEYNDFFPHVFRLMGGDPTKVTVTALPPAQTTTVGVALMQRGETDIFTEGIEFLPQMQAALPGKEVRYFVAKDYGLNTPGEALVASEKTIREKPDLVKRFLRATYKGLEDSLKDPDAAVRMFVKYWPEVNGTLANANMQQYVTIIFPGFGTKTGLQRGVMESDVASQTLNLLVQAGRTQPYDVSKAFTNEFLR